MDNSSDEHAITVQIPVRDAKLSGDLILPAGATSLVAFAHGSGSSRFSPRNRYVAESLHHAGFATLLLDLLTKEEEATDEVTRAMRFDVDLLASRLRSATEWLGKDKRTAQLAVGYFGASTGAAAALIAAAELGDQIRAVVSRGGRPDLAYAALEHVRAATLLIVGGKDDIVIELNQHALARLSAPVREITIVPGATHLFEEPGTLEQVARLAAEWFRRYLAREQLSD